jgi:hypothetical protein
VVSGVIRPLPRQSRIDRVLWQLVQHRRDHLCLLACVVAPLVVGLWVPETPGWLAIYAATCILAGIVVIVIQRSRDRWLQFLEFLRRSPR